MRKSLLFATSLIFCILIPSVSAKAGKPVSCGSDVTNLTVTIEGDPTNPSGYNVISDAGGPYVGTVEAAPPSRPSAASASARVTACPPASS